MDAFIGHFLEGFPYLYRNRGPFSNSSHLRHLRVRWHCSCYGVSRDRLASTDVNQLACPWIGFNIRRRSLGLFQRNIVRNGGCLRARLTRFSLILLYFRLCLAEIGKFLSAEEWNHLLKLLI